MERFWSKVDKADTCWNWTAGVKNAGYGQFRLNGKNWSVHRLSYVIHHGFIPEGKHVLHKCDNKLCVNPEHLEIGDRSKNMKDAHDRGRIKRERKVNQEQVLEIFDDPRKYRDIAKDYGISASLVSRIKNRQQFKRWLNESVH